MEYFCSLKNIYLIVTNFKMFNERKRGMIMIRKAQNDIRTAKLRAKVGEIAYVDNMPYALIKQGKKYDLISLDEIASQLYGREVVCEVKTKTI